MTIVRESQDLVPLCPHWELQFREVEKRALDGAGRRYR